MRPAKSPKSYKPYPPKIDRQQLGLQAPTAPVLSNQALFEEFLIAGCDFSESAAEEVRFLTGIIENSRFDRTKIGRPKLIDAIVDHSHFSNANWDKSILTRVRISSSKLTGFRTVRGDWSDIEFIGSKADFSSYALTRMRGVWFDNCVLVDADFQDCELENVRFSQCDLSRINFMGAKFSRVDLRGSKIDGVKISPSQFKGIIIEPNQATYLIGATGAKVAWPGEEVP